MEIFWKLILAHLLTDFTFQTDFIAGWKRKESIGALVHSLIFLVCGGILCYSSLNKDWLIFGKVTLNGWLALSLLTIFHFIEDEWRIWTIQKLHSPDSFGFFLWDQFVHYMFIIVFFPWAGGWYPSKFLLLSILFILTTHFTTIVVYYMNKEIGSPTIISNKEKYYFMIERFAIGAMLLLPGIWPLSFLGVLPLRRFVPKLLSIQKLSVVNLTVGTLLAILFGIVGTLLAR